MKYEDLKQTVSDHYDDGLKLMVVLYPELFDTDKYRNFYRLLEQELIANGYDVIERSLFHSQVRRALLEGYLKDRKIKHGN
jgi:hypothetical protein